VPEFQYDFEKVLANYSTEQIFNCDETGLQYHLLPQKTLVSLFEKRAEGRKKCKDRVMVCACANVTGTHSSAVYWEVSQATLFYRL